MTVYIDIEVINKYLEEEERIFGKAEFPNFDGGYVVAIEKVKDFIKEYIDQNNIKEQI